MKNLPCIVSLSAIAILLLLWVASSLGVSFPFALVASYVVGTSCAAGMIAFLLIDYGPQPTRLIQPAGRKSEARRALKEAAQASAAQRRSVLPVELPFNDPITENLMATIRVRNDPATLSLS